MTAEEVKARARECGADLVGIAPMDRFEGAPKQMDPRFVFPEAKAIVALAFRIPRGYLRGIEEGTHFYQYPAMGYASINEVYAPCVLRDLCCFLEDAGYEGVAWRNTGGRSPVSDMDGRGPSESPEELGRRLTHFEPTRPGQPAPDVFLHFRIAAYLCGLLQVPASVHPEPDSLQYERDLQLSQRTLREVWSPLSLPSAFVGGCSECQ